ncbi:hypothetical protein NKH14_26875 [Mesorhizobium sp. M1380]|uniref:hypothetical protein n=1 Tax=Mesorhizobium sp. M1380 TaxID=2957093 RepID=UPI00333ACA4A
MALNDNRLAMTVWRPIGGDRLLGRASAGLAWVGISAKGGRCLELAAKQAALAHHVGGQNDVMVKTRLKLS